MAMSDTVVRAFELPVQALECLDGREDGWALLRECWEQSTVLANWAVQQLLRADVVRLPGMEKLPKRPAIQGTKVQTSGRGKGKVGAGLYGLANEQFDFRSSWWAGACISASNILRGVERKYDAERLAVVWLRSKAPCTYRYPHPWPVHAQNWKGAGFDESGKPWVLLALPGGHVRLRLRGGPEFGRQMAMFRQVVEGSLPRLQLVIRQQGSSNGCHRPTLSDGGRPCRVLVKMVAEVPVREKTGDRTLVLLTDPNAFWVADLDGRRAWVLNRDDIRRTVGRLIDHEKHLLRLQRMSEDAKAERRLGSNRARKEQDRLDRLCLKDRRRLDSFTHEAAAQLAGFCGRQGVGKVFYLDRDRGFVSRFPWSELQSKLADKLKAGGVELCVESEFVRDGPARPTDPEAQAAPMAIDDDKDRPITREEYEAWVQARLARLQAARSGTVALRRTAAARKRRGSHPSVTSPSAKC